MVWLAILMWDVVDNDAELMVFLEGTNWGSEGMSQGYPVKLEFYFFDKEFASGTISNSPNKEVQLRDHVKASRADVGRYPLQAWGGHEPKRQMPMDIAPCLQRFQCSAAMKGQTMDRSWAVQFEYSLSNLRMDLLYHWNSVEGVGEYVSDILRDSRDALANMPGKNGLPKEDWQQPECIALPVVTQDRDFGDPRNSRLIEQGLNAEDLQLLGGYAEALHSPDPRWNPDFGNSRVNGGRTAFYVGIHLPPGEEFCFLWFYGLDLLQEEVRAMAPRRRILAIALLGAGSCWVISQSSRCSRWNLQGPTMTHFASLAVAGTALRRSIDLALQQLREGELLGLPVLLSSALIGLSTGFAVVLFEGFITSLEELREELPIPVLAPILGALALAALVAAFGGKDGLAGTDIKKSYATAGGPEPPSNWPLRAIPWARKHLQQRWAWHPGRANVAFGLGQACERNAYGMASDRLVWLNSDAEHAAFTDRDPLGHMSHLPRFGQPLFGLGNFPSPDAPNAERGGPSPGVKHCNSNAMSPFSNQGGYEEMRGDYIPCEVGQKRFGNTALKKWQERGWRVVNFTQVEGTWHWLVEYDGNIVVDLHRLGPFLRRQREQVLLNWGYHEDCTDDSFNCFMTEVTSMLTERVIFRNLKHAKAHKVRDAFEKTFLKCHEIQRDQFVVPFFLWQDGLDEDTEAAPIETLVDELGYCMVSTRVGRVFPVMSCVSVADVRKKETAENGTLTSQEDRELIEKALEGSKVVASLPGKELDRLLKYFQKAHLKVTLQEGDTLMKHGDEAQCSECCQRNWSVMMNLVFLSRSFAKVNLDFWKSGLLDVYVPDGEGEKKVFTYETSGAVVGELAVLFRAPRARTDAVLWSVDRKSFEACGGRSEGSMARMNQNPDALLASGAAAGVAAGAGLSFNAPIAGIFFASELLFFLLLGVLTGIMAYSYKKIAGVARDVASFLKEQGALLTVALSVAVNSRVQFAVNEVLKDSSQPLSLSNINLEPLLQVPITSVVLAVELAGGASYEVSAVLLPALLDGLDRNAALARILVARAPVPLHLNAGVDACLLCVYTFVSVFAYGKQELF
ncbi:hypothetical protein AK812_SmicGene18380 [Symbiodinium microadriaticum]|uniref:Cyclic nucleotide-binding domain-containing protein n=1 Tax=Symbiodinium microadriaticum TaxID=2951 RepID=A0A1Q9DV90_SYMMI|nr:hypothetical protein AK812_SmicGene18380 [Symbiodinium microadriaticum]